MGGSSEYEPRDSRNVTGTASTRDGRWTNRAGLPPLAAGGREKPRPLGEDAPILEDDRVVTFEPDPELSALIRRGPAP